MLFVVANERHNDLDGRPLCGGGAEEVLGALEGRSHVIPRDFVRLLVSYLAASSRGLLRFGVLVVIQLHTHSNTTHRHYYFVVLPAPGAFAE